MTPDEYRERLLAAVTPMEPFPQPVNECLGLAAAEDVLARVDLPGFDNSAMDGYAVRHADVAGDPPASLPVVGEIGAGTSRVIALAPGSAVKIMTGAPVPSGADTVVPYEWTDRGTPQVRIDRVPTPGQNVRRQGEEVRTGDVVVREGTVLGARHLGLLAAVGCAAVPVRPRPRVVVISTGSELREPGQPLAHDSVYDANSYLLAAAVRAAGAISYRVGIVPDEPKAFLDALQDQLVRADVVITSGGVSMGDYDVVKAALAPAGVWFGRIAMQPGQPQGFGLVGDDQVPLFALPGNPVSSYVSFESFVLPVLRKLMGIAPYTRPAVTARLGAAITSPRGKQQYLRGRSSDGVVTPVGGPGSHLIAGLAEADCLIVVPAQETALEEGAEVRVLMLDRTF